MQKMGQGQGHMVRAQVPKGAGQSSDREKPQPGDADEDS